MQNYCATEMKEYIDMEHHLTFPMMFYQLRVLEENWTTSS
jgi:hypothetical protein